MALVRENADTPPIIFDDSFHGGHHMAVGAVYPFQIYHYPGAAILLEHVISSDGAGVVVGVVEVWLL